MAVVIVAPLAAEQIEDLPRTIHGRVLKLLNRLSHWPEVSGAKSLSGALSGKFRLRTGDYRLQFHVVGDTVVVERVGHRDGFYGD